MSGAGIELLTVGEVAEELRISDTAVYRLLRAHQLSHVRVGVRRYLVTRDQLNEYIAAFSVGRRRADGETS